MVEVIALVLAVAACALFILALRRWFLVRAGAIDVSWRVRSRVGGRGWVLGLARYSGDDLLWFRVFSFLPRSSRVVSRRVFEIVGRRAPDGSESWAIQPGAVILECRNDGTPVQLAMGEEALTGFLSWLEASPPGYTLPGYIAG
ncbi:MAG TPA: DUF2550 domain-containing protein [Mycobacteriales bacterium]|nr:DUF2550 domain-containing protein [Mycobacteriales bacterium]